MREDGYYWVVWRGSGIRAVAYWENVEETPHRKSMWRVIGNELFYEDESFSAIGPKVEEP